MSSQPPSKDPPPPPRDKDQSSDISSPEWDRSGAQFRSKRNSEYLDPCQEFADRSLKCLRRNGGARDMCMDYFDAYRECKKNWQERLREEKRREGRWF